MPRVRWMNWRSESTPALAAWQARACSCPDGFAQSTSAAPAEVVKAALDQEGKRREQLAVSLVHGIFLSRWEGVATGIVSTDANLRAAAGARNGDATKWSLPQTKPPLAGMKRLARLQPPPYA